YMLANKVVNSHYNYYYYNKDVDSSTSDNKNFIRHIESIVRVFNDVRTVLNSNKKMGEYRPSIDLWEDRLLWLWKEKNCRGRSEAVSYIEPKMHNKELALEERKEFYYYHHQDVMHQYAYEDIKKQIVAYDVISFDVFDTLLIRPFWEPTDLFAILEDYVNKRLQTVDSIHFKTIRVEAEKVARHTSWVFNNKSQDITLDDIYEKIGAITCLDTQILEEIKAKEIELELKYLTRRHSGYELYAMAKHLGKKVIIASDMYLSKEVIQAALEKNGYTDFDAIFVSSEFNLTKHTGDLFRHIKKIYSGKRILHGGDNYHSDVEKPRQVGFESFYLPKPVDLIEGRNSWAYSGTFFSSLRNKTFGMIRTETAYKFLGFRCALALVANKLFDNPFAILSYDSDFQGDTNRIGYSVLGMHVLANCLNLKDHAHKYDTILFYARDGHLIKRAFELFKNSFQLAVRTEYCYCSRKSLMPLFLSKKEDLYSLIEYFGRHTVVEDVLKVLSNISKYNLKESVERAKKHINFDISDRIGWMKFITFFADELYSQEKVDQYRSAARKYFSRICVGKCASFDVGYSFRTDYLLKRLYGYDVTPYVMHVNDEYPFMRAENADMKWHSILTYSPLVSGGFRETCVSEVGPSCIGYDTEGAPILEKFSPDYPSCLELNSLHNGAVQFVKDYLAVFADDFGLMRMRYFDLCLPFEVFNIEARYADRKWTECIDFEDDLCEGHSNTLLDLWNKQTAWTMSEANIRERIKISNKEKIKKIFVDRDKNFIKYYSYKLLSKITGGKLRKRAIARKNHYRHMLLSKL
ncbi:HAD-IA family hydrolase, partial [Mailhella sp.]|uniref:HAD-IA family hydrolase n=1 Tax=Mailhella sp. TaxID=1981029 RepID=UPI004063D2BF